MSISARWTAPGATRNRIQMKKCLLRIGEVLNPRHEPQWGSHKMSVMNHYTELKVNTQSFNRPPFPPPFGGVPVGSTQRQHVDDKQVTAMPMGASAAKAVRTPCACGGVKRVGKHECRSCHAKKERARRKTQLEELKELRKMHADLMANNWVTRQRFVDRFGEDFRVVVKDPERSRFGRVIAFMPGDIVAVQDDFEKQRIELLHFDQILRDNRFKPSRPVLPPCTPGEPKDPMVRRVLRLSPIALETNGSCLSRR